MNKTHTNKRLGTIIVSGVIAIRFIAVPLFLYTFINDLVTWSLGILLLAVFTDALDGYAGRRLGASPLLGSYSDATVDFVLVLAAFSAFVMKGIYPFWMLLLIVGMFTQFILTSRMTNIRRLDRPVYDPVGKYYGVSLFAAIGLTLILPYAAVYNSVLVGIVGFTIASVISRAIFLLGLSKEQALGHDNPSA